MICLPQAEIVQSGNSTYLHSSLLVLTRPYLLLMPSFSREVVESPHATMVRVHTGALQYLLALLYAHDREIGPRHSRTGDRINCPEIPFILNSRLEQLNGIELPIQVKTSSSSS